MTVVSREPWDQGFYERDKQGREVEDCSKTDRVSAVQGLRQQSKLPINSNCLEEIFLDRRAWSVPVYLQIR